MLACDTDISVECARGKWILIGRPLSSLQPRKMFLHLGLPMAYNLLRQIESHKGGLHGWFFAGGGRRLDLGRNV